MIDLKSKPFYLNDQQIRKVQSILDSMTLDEKIGQVFCPIGSSFEEKEIVEFIEKYKPGAMMYRPLESTKIKQIHETIQNYSKIPLMLAANLESGGNGICIDGTYFSRQMGVAATNDLKQAYHLGMIAGKEANAVLCNWSFAPIVDIDFNYLNPITNIRTYGSDKEKVIAYTKQQINALREYNVIPCIKHFPGDGVDMRDQHLVSSVNDLTVKQWDESYGNIYSSFIDEGIETIMVGHMLLPHYVKYFNSTIKDEDILPASLSKEVLTNLLREKLSFNGMVVTDATAMIGYNVALPRSQAIPLSIENGCDMILFNKDIDEDYTFMKKGLENGLLSLERLNEAVLRILATKMANGVFENKKPLNEIDVVGCKEHQELAYQCASKAITLVKNKQDILPITPQKYKNIRLYHLTDTSKGGFKESGSQKKIEDYLNDLGFNVDVYDENQLDFHEIFETGVSYLKDKYDLVNWYFEKLVLKSFEEMNQGGSLQEALNLKFAFIEQEHAFFKEAFKSNDYNNLIHYDFCCIYDFYKNYIYKNTGKTLSSDIDFLLNMYCRGSVDMTVEWVLNDIPIKKEEIVSYLIEAIPDKLKEYMK